jgi:putative ABC transport system substrate-binding protein
MMKRREFITLVGGAAAWPLAVRAQQPALPVIGWLGAGSPDTLADRVTAFRKGVNETGLVEGRTVAIEFRWAEGRVDRLPALAAELVRRPVAAILASGGTLPTRAAKAATSTLPIVFTTNNDPVAAGLVASLNRPGGNVTGVNSMAGETGAKQLGLLHELVPAAATMGLLVNPKSPAADASVRDLQMAVRSLGLQLRVLRAGTEREIDEVFAGFAQRHPDVLLVQNDPFFGNQRNQIASLAARNTIPTIYASRDFAAAGGLMSYGASSLDGYHQAGIYIGRILKGEKPADLPVVQSTKFELVINLQTAKALGLTVPPTLLAIADEVIE